MFCLKASVRGQKGENSKTSTLAHGPKQSTRHEPKNVRVRFDIPDPQNENDENDDSSLSWPSDASNQEQPAYQLTLPSNDTEEEDSVKYPIITQPTLHDLKHCNFSPGSLEKDGDDRVRKPTASKPLAESETLSKEIALVDVESESLANGTQEIDLMHFNDVDVFEFPNVGTQIFLVILISICLS